MTTKSFEDRMARDAASDMTTTPRTDALYAAYGDPERDIDVTAEDIFDLADKLETELTASRAECERLREALENLVCAADELTDGQLSADCKAERDFIKAHEAARAALRGDV